MLKQNGQAGFQTSSIVEAGQKIDIALIFNFFLFHDIVRYIDDDAENVIAADDFIHLDIMWMLTGQHVNAGFAFQRTAAEIVKIFQLFLLYNCIIFITIFFFCFAYLKARPVPLLGW